MKKILIFLIPVFFTFSKGVFAFNLVHEVHSFTLSNGMLWFVVYRPSVPVFSGLVMVKAGGLDEEEGKTGLAHMFEHMAFKGSKKIGTKNFAKEIPILNTIAKVGRDMSEESQKEKPDPAKIAAFKKKIQELTEEEYQYMIKNEIWMTLSRKGAGDLNAFTTKDVTAYHASMPVSAFPTWAFVASEMVFHPVLREFYQERDVVMEERRLRYDNSPYGYLFENLVQTAFPDGPYHWSPIGSPKDLVGLTMEDAASFHQRYYVPQNIVGVLVGDISMERARTVLEKYFGAFPAAAVPKKSEGEKDYSFQGEKRKAIHFPSEPYLVIAFHKPKAPAQTDYVFDLIDGILCEGRTARLNYKLVKVKKMASSITCVNGFPGSRLDNLFLIYASPIHGHSVAELEKEILAELQALSERVDQKELERVKNKIVYDFYWGLESNMDLAEQLAGAQVTIGDWKYIATFSKKIESIGPKEVNDTAKKYFQPNNRVILQLVRGNR